MNKSASSKPRFASQLDTLINRQLAIFSGSKNSVLILLIQAPLIGYFIGLAWQGNDAEETTYFIMAVAAVWLGCMNACCAIVRERNILERERMFNVSLWAYVISKLCVLAVIGTIQSLSLLTVQAHMMNLPGSLLEQGLMFLFLCLSTFTATALGLLVSAMTRSTYAAVMAVPILLIPQVIFSEVLLQSHIQRHLPSLLEKFTITKWGYDALTSLSKVNESLDWETLGLSFGILIAALAALIFATVTKLRIDDF